MADNAKLPPPPNWAPARVGVEQGKEKGRLP